MLLPEDFHDRALGPASVSFDEELLNRRRINEFVEIEGLRYAQAVARTSSFSAAAREYDLTQPTLSNTIRRLEKIRKK